jgi:hypothetical protein
VSTLTEERRTHASDNTEDAIQQLTGTVGRTIETLEQRANELKSMFERIGSLVGDMGEKTATGMNTLAEGGKAASVGLRTAVGVLKEAAELFGRLTGSR